MRNLIVQEAEELSQELIATRRAIHQNPELSFQEFQTKELVIDKFKKIPGVKIEYSKNLETAVIATIANGEGPCIAVRADMDALPIVEETNRDYASKVNGVMHACGHDAHTAIGLGVAKLIGRWMSAGTIKGTVKFIFQPAEEAADSTGKTGAAYLVEEGLLDDVDAVLALHMSPEQEVGNILIHDGYSMANVDVFEATISGTGGHGAYPHLGTDPIWMLGPVMQAIHGIVARQISPLDPAVISIGEIRAGSASNIIPSEVYLQGTLRSYSPKVREELIGKLHKAISIAEVLGGEYTFKAMKGEPALYNDKRINEVLKQHVKTLYPMMKIIDKPFGLGGEDFSHMAAKVPGAMFFLGCAPADQLKRELHTPIFDIDESCLPIGVAIIAQTVHTLLTGEQTILKKSKNSQRIFNEKA
ncbi:M20 family metallopeptidase [Niallia sp. NCCP-28]|uniref:M20 metallopeptidase family protein n=1 Tax=Niallia sp. NCCP-28 TaxID=2934712 RepID=UPI0020872C37|nr:M20 family metallopeptidase [Niallia sp. NCCP-28]GKU83627.1 amidohydrolase [Niallia sp. NCCP-28]